MAATRRPEHCPEHSGLAARLDGLGVRLTRIEEKLDSLAEEKLPGLSQDIAALKIRAGIWGMFSGAVGAVMTQLGFHQWGRP